MSKFEDFFNRLQELTPINTQADLARELGVGRAAISIAKQKDAIPSKWIFELSEKFGLNPAYLLEGRGPAFTGEREVLVALKKFSSEDEIPQWGTLHVMEEQEIPSEMWLMEIKTRSMEPSFSPGDIVIIEPCSILEYGRIHLVRYKGKLYLRRAEPYGEKLLLIADNDRYPALEVMEEDIEVIGIAKYLFRTL